MSGCEIIDHTADIGIHVWGKTVQELFINAAEGTMDLVLSYARTLVRLEKHKVQIEAVDKEQLLVKWLQEILYLFEIKKEMPINFEISDLSDTSLSAEIGTVPFDPQKCEIKYQIKAVTYHQIAIKKVSGRFEATVIFDI